MIPLRDEDPLEERLRRLLGLPADAPDPNPAVWENGEVHFIQGEKLQRERDRWIAEDRRADWARLGAKALRPLGREGWLQSAAAKVVDPWKKKQQRRRLRRTSFLLFLPRNEIDDTPWAIEGDLLFEGGSLPMVLLAAGGLASHVDRESQNRVDYLFCEENDLVFEERWIILPGKTVTTKGARRALGEWYREIFKHDRHHFTQQGLLPRIEVVEDTTTPALPAGR